MSRVSHLRHVARELRVYVIKLRRMTLRDWVEVVVTAATGLAVEAGLRTMQLPTLARRLGVPLDEHPPDEAQPPRPIPLPPDELRRLQLSAAVMRRWPFDEKCLRMSLACGHRIRSHRPSLVVGVALAGGELKAHAWLTVDGVSLDPSGSSTFSSLRSIPR
jgi:Transglutaminase-like superfamily